MEAQKLITEAVEWSGEAEEFLTTALNAGSLEDYRDAIEAGAVLFRVSQGGECVGFYLLMVERCANRNEGVIIAAAGRAGVDLVALSLPVIEKQFIGVDYIVINTHRAGMMKKLAGQGWELAQVRMKKRVKNG